MLAAQSGSHDSCHITQAHTSRTLLPNSFSSLMRAPGARSLGWALNHTGLRRTESPGTLDEARLSEAATLRRAAQEQTRFCTGCGLHPHEDITITKNTFVTNFGDILFASMRTWQLPVQLLTDVIHSQRAATINTLLCEVKQNASGHQRPPHSLQESI